MFPTRAASALPALLRVDELVVSEGLWLLKSPAIIQCLISVEVTKLVTRRMALSSLGRL